MLNKAFRNNGFVVSVGNGLGSVLFPCPPANVFLRQQTSSSGISWSGCGNYGYNDTSIANYNYYTDGNCGEYWTLAGSWSRPDGDTLYDTGCCQVIYSGGSYYVNDNCNPCGDANTPTGQTRQVEPSSFFWSGCGSDGTFTYSVIIETEYNDGTCGTYWIPTGYENAYDGQEIYSTGCCTVNYTAYNNSYTVSDNCGCPSSGTVLNSGGGTYDLYWEACGNSGMYTYGTYGWTEYADGNCGSYTYGGDSYNPAGSSIWDNGCCFVTYDGNGGYSVNDTCGGGGGEGGGGGCPPYGEYAYSDGCIDYFHNGECGYYSVDNCGNGYPSEGTLLNSGGGDIISNITWGSEMGQQNFQQVTLGTSWWEELADGMGGSYTVGGNNYLSDGTLLFTEPYGINADLNWAVETGYGFESGMFTYGNTVGNWTINSGEPSRTSTSIIDIITDGYIIYESSSWWNGEANVKAQVIFQSGGGYITTTITF